MGALMHFKWIQRVAVLDVGATGVYGCLPSGALFALRHRRGTQSARLSLRQDPRVISREKVNARELTEAIVRKS